MMDQHLNDEIKLHVETVVERFCNSFVMEFTSNMNLMVLTQIIVIFGQLIELRRM